LKKNIAKFRQHFDNFLVLISLFLFYVYGLTLAWNLGYEYNMTMAILPAMSVLIYYSGVLMEKSKRNWFIGFRNPWTLSSDKVWAKTNKMGGKLFKFVAIASLIGIAFENYYVYIFIAPLLIGVVYLTIYSYLEYKKEKG